MCTPVHRPPPALLLCIQKSCTVEPFLLYSLPPSQQDTAVCLPAVLQGTVEVAKRGQKSGAKKLCEALWDSCASRFHPCCLLREGQMVYTYLDEITRGRHKASKRTCIRNGSKERDENNSQRQNKSGSLRQVSCIKDFEVNVFQQMQTLTLPFFIHLPFRRPCQSPTVKSFPQTSIQIFQNNTLFGGGGR